MSTNPSGSGQPVSPVWFASFLASAAALVIARIELFSTGVWYGEGIAHLLDVVIAVLVGCTVLFGATWYLGRRPTRHGHNEPSGHILEVAATLVTLAISSFALIEIFFPASPSTAAAPACSGAPVNGSSYLAQTPELGVNSRSGPGTDFPQVNRYSGNCTLGFDGYCVGDPVPDRSNGGYLDDRWLIVHRRDDEFVSAAELLAQSPSIKLGKKPAKLCRKAGGLPLPSGLHLHVTGERSQLDALWVSVHGASLVGYAIRVIGPTIAGDDPYSGIGNPLSIFGDGYNFPGVWKLSTAYDDLPGNSGEVMIAAEVCLALGVPNGDPSIVLLRFEHRASTSVSGLDHTRAITEQRLAQAACAGPD